jgi:hypothetical protein
VTHHLGVVDGPLERVEVVFVDVPALPDSAGLELVGADE